MRKHLTALAAVAAPLVALTLGASPAHASSNYSQVIFQGSSGPDYCLDIPGNNAVVGQQLMAWPCDPNDDAQLWIYSQTDSTHFQLQSKSNPGLCANNWQGGAVSGNDIKLYYCNGDADGTWNWVGGSYNKPIQPKSAWHNCLNIWGGLASGNPAKLYQCGDYSNEDVVIAYA